MTRLGTPRDLPMATAVTASGGPTTAPSTRAAPNVISGTAQKATPPTANAVTSTSTTPRRRMGWMFCTKLGTEKSSAVEYSRGGSTMPRMMCASSSSRGMPGMYEAARPTTSTTSGGWSPRRWASPVTAIAAITTSSN